MHYSLLHGIRKIKTGLVNTTFSLVILASGLSGTAPLFLTRTAHAAGLPIYTKAADTTVSEASGYTSSTINASSYTNLELNLNYDIYSLDNGDSLTYGWEAGGTQHVLATINGVSGDADNTFAPTPYTLPAAAQVNDLQLYATVAANTSTDQAVLSNITLTGDSTAPAPVVTPGEFTTISDTAHYYKGIDVGFSLNNGFGTLTGLSAKLYDADGLIGTNTALQPMLDYYNNGGRSFTTPFVIQPGAYDPSTETYWSFSSYNWDRNNVPTKVVISATGTSGTNEATGTNLAFGGGAFADLFPAVPAATVTAENFNTHDGSDYKGINVGFGMSNFQSVSSIKVELYSQGNKLVANTANATMIAEANNKEAGFYPHASTAFFIQDGTYGKELYWNLGVHNWKATDTPTAAVITVVGKTLDGREVTRQATTSQALTGPAFSSLLPASTPSAPSGLFFTQGAKTLSCGDATNSASAPTLHWVAPNGNINQYVITPNYPDNSGEYPFYPAGSATAAWVTGNFGIHGQGVYSYTIKAQNSAGQWSTAATCALVYDNVQPVIAIQSPAANSFVRGTVTVHAKITENGSGVKRVDAKFTDGSSHGSTPNEFGTVTLHLVAGTSDIYEGQIDTTGHNGVYNVAVDAWDNANNSRSAKNQTVTIDNIKPTLSDPTAVVEPGTPGSKTYHLSPKNTPLLVKSGDKVTVTIKVDGTGSPVDIATVRAYEQNVAAGNWHTYLFPDQTMTDNGNGTYSYTFTVPDKYTTGDSINQDAYKNALDFNTKDQAGNTRGTELYFTIDNTAPVISPVTVTTADGTTENAKDATLRGQGTFHVNQTEAHPNRMYVEYDQLGNDGKWHKLANTGWVTNTNTADLAVNTATWSDGTYQIKVSSDDQVWNHGGSSTTFTIDNTAPVITVKNATWNDPKVAAIADGSTVSTAVDKNLRLFTDEKNISGILMDGSTKWSGSWITGAGGVGIAYLTSGTHTFQAVDLAGNLSSKITLTFDNTAPDVPTLNAPADASDTSDTTPTFSWTGSNDTYRYQIQVSTSSDVRATDGAFRAADLVEQHNPSADSYTFTNTLAEGTYYWHVRARDAAGNWSAYSTVWKFTVDTTGPSLIYGGFDQNKNVITPKYTDADANDTYQWVADAGNPSGATISDATALNPDFTVTTDGNYSFTLTASDSVGNTTTAVLTFTYTAPDTITPPQSHIHTNAVTPNGGRGGGFTGVNGQVLGASTTIPNNATGADNNANSDSNKSDSGNVKGDSVDLSSNATKKPDTNSNSAFLGLGWWWLLILAVIAGLLWFILGRRSDGTDTTA